MLRFSQLVFEVKMMTERLKISLTEEMYQALSKLSTDTGTPMAHLIREATADYLKKNKIKVKDIHPTWGGLRQPQ